MSCRSGETAPHSLIRACARFRAKTGSSETRLQERQGTASWYFSGLGSGIHCIKELAGLRAGSNRDKWTVGDALESRTMRDGERVHRRRYDIGQHADRLPVAAGSRIHRARDW